MQIITSIHFSDSERTLFQVLPRVGHIAFPVDHLPQGGSGPEKKQRASDPNASTLRLFTRVAEHNEPFTITDLTACLTAARRLRDELAAQTSPDWWTAQTTVPDGDGSSSRSGTGMSLFASNPIPVLVEARQVMVEQVDRAVAALETAVAAANGSVPVDALVG